MKILIIGGTGVISRAVVEQALMRGHEVTAVNRGSKTIGFENRVRSIVADRKDAAGFANALRNERPDVVIDMIAFGPEEAKQTLELFRARAAQIIITSSIAAYERPYKSLPTREDAETLLTGSTFAYGQMKADMERWLDGEMEKPGAGITVIRPSLTYGPGARNFGTLRQNYNVVQRIRDGRPVVMIGEGKTAWAFTYVDDLAQGYLLACGNARTYGGRYHIASGELAVWDDLYRFVGEIVGRAPVMYNVPSALLREYDPVVATHLNVEKVFCNVYDCDKFRAAAPEFKPVWKFKDGMAKMIESWEKDGLGVDPAKTAQEDHLCACWERFRKDLLGK